MPRHIEAYIDGVPLSSVGPVIIQQVYEDAPTLELTEGERPGRYGSRLLTKKRQSLKVTLEIAIRELFDLNTRARTMEAVAAWAKGSVLVLSSKPDKMLEVTCTAEPTLGAVRDYTATARIEFTAYNVPYWQDTDWTSTAVSGTSATATLEIPGTVAAPVSIDVTPVSGTLTSLSVTAGGATISLTGLTATSAHVLTFERDVRDDLIIIYNGASQLSHRSAASADDLMSEPGSASISLTANTSVTATFKTRGRWA